MSCVSNETELLNLPKIHPIIWSLDRGHVNHAGRLVLIKRKL